MIKNALSISIIILFFGCISTEKLLEKGKYEQALRKSSQKLLKNTNNIREVDIFNRAYAFLYERDNQSLDRLKAKKDPRYWDQILTLLNTMDERQNLAISIPNNAIRFEERNYFDEMRYVREKAADYSYSLGIRLLNKGNRFDARKAYDQFFKVRRYNEFYEDIEDKIGLSRFLGTTNVLFKIENKSNIIVPKHLMDMMKTTYTDDMNSEWLNYDNDKDSSLQYHYYISLQLHIIDVSPESLREDYYIENTEIPDGFEYELDKNGNVKKDSLGNDIKNPKSKLISCQIIEFEQRKDARVEGSLVYYDYVNDQYFKTEPISVNAVFEHYYSLANGDLDALSIKSKKKLDSHPIPFPNDQELIFQAAESLKILTKELLVQNRRLLD